MAGRPTLASGGGRRLTPGAAWGDQRDEDDRGDGDDRRDRVEKGDGRDLGGGTTGPVDPSPGEADAGCTPRACAPGPQGHASAHAHALAWLWLRAY